MTLKDMITKWIYKDNESVYVSVSTNGETWEGYILDYGDDWIILRMSTHGSFKSFENPLGSKPITKEYEDMTTMYIPYLSVQCITTQERVWL